MSPEPDMSSILFPFCLVVLLISIGVVTMHLQLKKSILKQKFEKERIKAEHQGHLIQTYVQAQENERGRIARDLHDELGASLSISRMLLVQLEDENNKKITDVRHLVEQTLASTRRISHELMPMQLENLGLEKALKSLISKISEANQNLDLSLSCSNSPKDLPKFIELNLYRIISELLNNTIKYASAKRVVIEFNYEDEQLICQYLDNGVGLPDPFEPTGMGFKSIETRILSCNGEWNYNGQSNNGFQANILIPLNNSNHFKRQ